MDGDLGRVGGFGADGVEAHAHGRGIEADFPYDAGLFLLIYEVRTMAYSTDICTS